MDEHEHDLVRVEDTVNGQAWQKCRSCPHRTDAAPWTPPTEESFRAHLAALAGQES